MRAWTSLRTYAVKSKTPPEQLIDLLSKSFEEVKGATSFLDEIGHRLHSKSPISSQLSSVLLRHRSSWKAYLTHPQLVDHLFLYFNLLRPDTQFSHYRELLYQGSSREHSKIFLPHQSQTILSKTCTESVRINWRVLIEASIFMKQQDSLDPYLLDKFTALCSGKNAPIDVMVEYLNVTWKTQPVNYELEGMCRERLRREWGKVNVLKALLMLLKSPVRGDMLLHLHLLSRIDQSFIDQLRNRESIMCLGILAKCRSRQLHVPLEVFTATAKRCRLIVNSAETKELVIIGKALSQVNFGENEFYAALRKKAEEKLEKVEFLEFLEQTVAPTVETI